MSAAARHRVVAIGDGRGAICREILDDLPEWFGIAAARDAYVAEASHLPMLGTLDAAEPAGFVSLKVHTPFACELAVLGVKRRLHGQGIGRALVTAARDFARREGLSYLTVKTLAATHPDPHYAATRAFYAAMGFVPIEVLPSLWGSGNPCLLMIRPV